MERPLPGSSGSPGSERGREPPRALSFVSIPRSARDPELGTSAEGTLLSHAWTVLEGRWLVLASLAVAFSLAGGYLAVATPIYVAESVVQFESRRRGLAGLDELTAALGESPPADPEIEIIRSRSLVGGVVEQLQLDLVVQPARFPVLGGAMARRYRGAGPAPASLLRRWAWGGERLRVSALEVPDALLEQRLRLVAGEGGRYRLLDDEDDALLLEGTAGTAAGSAGGPRLTVTELVARPGTRFFLTRRHRDHVVDALLGQLRVQEKGRKSGIISIQLDGSDPRQIADVVNGVAAAYLRQNVERRSAEAAKTLEFLETQLPTLRARVDAAESALNRFRVSSGTVDTTAEAKNLLDRSASLAKEISDAEARRAELRQSFTDSHPNLVAVANRLAILRSEQASLQAKIRAAPKTELDSARLGRELKDATDLYVALLNRAQELRVAKSGTIGDVRIIDRAPVADRPASPRPPLVLLLALVGGLAFGVAGAILRRAWLNRAETPDDVEAATGLPVYVTVPHSDAQAALSRARPARGAGPRLLADAAPADVAIESIRSLRTSLQFALVESRNNAVVLTGPAPGTGKSFVAVNLAHVLAAAGRRVLLVDCDLRRGHLHRQLGFERKPGVSEVVSGDTLLDDALREASVPGLSLLPTGRIPPNPAELLSSQRFEALLRELSARFDLVIVDTPPLLAVTDAVLVARLAGVNFLVVRAGVHTTQELSLAAKQFTLGGIRLHGTVLNDVRPTARARYGRGGYVQYAYASEKSPQ